jgi:diguanylate cyclase (GGDEF)-like protein/PAS domain S-box-containing protein
VITTRDFSDIWSLAIDGSGTGIWDRNVITGEIRYSPGWYAILGYEEVSDSDQIEISYRRVHPDDLDYVQATIQDHFDQRTEVYEVEHRLRCKNGSFKWVLSRGKVISRDNTGRPLRMVGTTTDITKTRDLAEQLRAQHVRAREDSDRLAALADKLTERTEELSEAHRLARIGNWRWNLENRCLWFSRETWWIMGYDVPSLEPVTYEQMRAMIHPHDYTRAMERYYAAIKTKTAVTLEYRIIHPDGSIHDVLTHAEPILGSDGLVTSVRGTSQDITPYRRIEAALQESEDHYRHMVDLHPQSPWTAGPDGGLLEIGPQWLKMTGMTKDKAVPFGWIGAIYDQDRPRVLAAWQSRLRTGKHLDIEFQLRLADGGYGWVRARAAPRIDDAGQIIRWYGSLEDVTDLHMAEEARRAYEGLAFRVLEATGDAVMVCDRTGRVTFANTKAVKEIGDGANLNGLTVEQIFADSHGKQIKDALNHAIDAGVDAQFEVFWPPVDRWFEVRLYSSKDDVSLFLHDISEKHIAQKKLNYAAMHDLLTGALNRETLFAQLAVKLTHQQPGDLVALSCLDLEHFKEVNDTHGHPFGDELLKLVVSRVKRCLRSHDLLGRTGGDEFLVMQTGIRAPADALALAKRIIKSMEQPFVIEGVFLAGSLSIGIAVSMLGNTDPDQLYQQADLALHEAKARARGHYQLFRPEMQVVSDAVRHMRTDLVAALAREELSLAFQPIVNVSDRRIVGVEALARWQHPERGAVFPAEFIPVAEETGLIADLGAWVLRQACTAARRWPDDVKISVNVSPRQFELSDVAKVVSDALTASGLPAKRLQLEVTESVLLSKNADFLRILRECKAKGVNLALDDFGTGYSSLAYLDTFKFDFLKIDKSFLSKIRATSDRQPIFEAIMKMAIALKLPVTAEGIEDEVQFEYIRSLGCDFAQGYLFAKPMTENKLLDFFTNSDGLRYPHL